MGLRSLNALRPLRNRLIRAYRFFLTRIIGFDLDPTATFSLKARFDWRNPKGLRLGAGSYVAFDALILTYNEAQRSNLTTTIGKNCFIGARSLIAPGVTIGDHCIIGAGSVVLSDIPPGSLAVGNPAHILRSGIITQRYGRLIEADAAQSQFAKELNSPHFALERESE